MKVALVGPELEENLSIRYLAGALAHAGHECSIVPFNRRRDIRRVARAVFRARPDLVGLSLVAQRRFADFLELTRLLRENGFAGHITAGGHFASLRAEEILRDAPGIDSIIHHDGEERIVALAQALESAGGRRNRCAPGIQPASRLDDGGAGDWPAPRLDAGGAGAPPAPRLEGLDGISWRLADRTIAHNPPVRVADLDRLAFPERRRPDRILGFAAAPIVSSRGCAGACSFCSIHAWHKQVGAGRLRFRSPKNVAAEMIALNREHGVRIFTFHDDDFIHPDPREARERCRGILEAAEQGIGESIAFIVKCRPDEVDEKLFTYLKSKGLVRVYVGIETHSRLGIRTLNRRTTPAANERALAILRHLGVYPCFNLLIFHPDSTLEELDENLDFLSRHLDQPFDVGRTELYAHSALEDRMVREGRALLDYRGYDYRIGDCRAETVFELFARILWERHFGEDSILHRVQDLGFRLGVLTRFLPEAVSADALVRVDSLIREVNADTVNYMRRLIDAARDEGLATNPRRRASFADSMRNEVGSRVRRQTIRWAALNLELESRARLGRMRPAAIPALTPWPRLLGRAATAVPLVGLAFAAFGCDHTMNSCDPLPPPPVHFAADIEPRLNQTCTASGCHSAQNPAAGLDLTTGHSYGNLVNVPSVELPTMDRVEPSRDDSSYVVYKLEGEQLTVGGSGEKMPKGGTLDPGLFSKILHWISGGAKNN